MESLIIVRYLIAEDNKELIEAVKRENTSTACQQSLYACAHACMHETEVILATIKKI